MGSIFDILNTAQNGLKTEREAMEIAALNVSNQLTPGYKAKSPVITANSHDYSFSQLLASLGKDREGIAPMLLGDEIGSGPQVAQIEVDQSPGVLVYMPHHPLADENGNVEMSNVDGAAEMIHMMEAVRQYKANLSIVEMAKKASQEALNMTKNG
jgi:flagellar basal-body rod protein FlgC